MENEGIANSSGWLGGLNRLDAEQEAAEVGGLVAARQGHVNLQAELLEARALIERQAEIMEHQMRSAAQPAEGPLYMFGLDWLLYASLGGGVGWTLSSRFLRCFWECVWGSRRGGAFVGVPV